MEKPRILLINPSLTGSLSSGIFTVKTPLGLAYIAGYLKDKGYKPEILDCMAYYNCIEKINGKYRIGLPEKEIVKNIKKGWDIIGVSCGYTIHEQDAFKIAELVKKNSKAIVVFGGAHTSANPEQVLKNKNVDIAVIGEGELVFCNLIKNLKNWKKVKGIAYKKKAGIIKNHSQEFIENLDELRAARELLDMGKYLKHPQNAIANMRHPTTEIISSRGCPFNCIFCSIKTVWGRKWRARSASNVVDELEFLHKKYGIQEFRFFDDNISWDKKRIIAICDEIIKRKLDIKWDTPNGVAISTLDKEVLSKMKKSGYYKIVMGIESGSEKSLRFMRKPLNLKKAREIIAICNKLGIWTWSTFVIGFPEESIKDINKTIEFASSSGLNFATFYIAQPYPGTEMYQIYESLGLLKEGMKEESSVTNTKYNTKYFSAQQLQDLQKKAYSKFIRARVIRYLNPCHLYNEFLNRIKSWEDVRFVARMFLALLGREYSPIYEKK